MTLNRSLLGAITVTSVLKNIQQASPSCHRLVWAQIHVAKILRLHRDNQLQGASTVHLLSYHQFYLLHYKDIQFARNQPELIVDSQLNFVDEDNELLTPSQRLVRILAVRGGLKITGQVLDNLNLSIYKVSKKLCSKKYHIWRKPKIQEIDKKAIKQATIDNDLIKINCESFKILRLEESATFLVIYQNLILNTHQSHSIAPLIVNDIFYSSSTINTYHSSR